MTRLIIRWFINAVAVWVAAHIVHGIMLTSESPAAIIVIALILGLLNATLNPLLKLLTCPFILLTLGLGALLINTLVFWLAGEIGQSLGYGFTVDGFWSAFLGALVVSVVSVILGVFLKEETDRPAPREM
ncbi:MAG: phage holin family protein [Anaerolineales bacterium]|jgi:putative membrane protein